MTTRGRAWYANPIMTPLSEDPAPQESLTVTLQTPAGELSTTLEIPTHFIPVTEIVPSLRQLGEDALALEQRKADQAGRSVSCQNGCAACCRMLVPISAPEAYRLSQAILNQPQVIRQKVLQKLDLTKRRLAQAGLLSALQDISETTRTLTDAEIEPLNQAYYALKIPCPFLEEESCSIYEHRPAACRELLVTSDATLCQDIANNPVAWLPVPLRISTILGLLWSALTGGPLRFIPLPLALDWVQQHPANPTHKWPGKDLFAEGLNHVWRFLNQEFANRGIQPPSPPQKG